MQLRLATDGHVDSLAWVPARAAIGSALIYHGASKLRGQGPEQTGGYFESIGIRPGKPWAVAAGLTELASGILAVLGIGTRLAALGLLVTQSVAVAKVHRDKGFDITSGGFEYNLALMAVALGLLIRGPGKISLHGAAAHRLEHLPWTRKIQIRRYGLWRGLIHALK